MRGRRGWRRAHGRRRRINHDGRSSSFLFSLERLFGDCRIRIRVHVFALMSACLYIFTCTVRASTLFLALRRDEQDFRGMCDVCDVSGPCTHKVTISSEDSFFHYHDQQNLTMIFFVFLQSYIYQQGGKKQETTTRQDDTTLRRPTTDQRPTTINQEEGSCPTRID